MTADSTGCLRTSLPSMVQERRTGRDSFQKRSCECKHKIVDGREKLAVKHDRMRITTQQFVSHLESEQTWQAA